MLSTTTLGWRNHSFGSKDLPIVISDEEEEGEIIELAPPAQAFRLNHPRASAPRLGPPSWPPESSRKRKRGESPFEAAEPQLKSQKVSETKRKTAVTSSTSRPTSKSGPSGRHPPPTSAPPKGKPLPTPSTPARPPGMSNKAWKKMKKAKLQAERQSTMRREEDKMQLDSAIASSSPKAVEVLDSTYPSTTMDLTPDGRPSSFRIEPLSSSYTPKSQPVSIQPPRMPPPKPPPVAPPIPPPIVPPDMPFPYWDGDESTPWGLLPMGFPFSQAPLPAGALMHSNPFAEPAPQFPMISIQFTPQEPPPQPVRPPQQRSIKTIGMPASSDTNSYAGIFKVPIGEGPEAYYPDPTKTLIMEFIPRKYRVSSWVKTWCDKLKKSGIPSPIHVEHEFKGGKVLLEFASTEHAKAAFRSPRMLGGGGEGGVRLFWLRPPTASWTARGLKQSVETEYQSQEEAGVLPSVPASLPPAVPPPTPPSERSQLPIATVREEDTAKIYMNLETPVVARVSPNGMLRQPAFPYIAPLSTTNPHFTTTKGTSSHSPRLPQRDRDPWHEPLGSEPISMSTPLTHVTSSIYEPVSTTPSSPPSTPISTPSTASLAAPLLAPTPQHPLNPSASPFYPFMQSPQPLPSVHQDPVACTPSVPIGTPSEPRAMKNTPPTPGFPKRSLDARQKELEERIAQSKLELQGLPPALKEQVTSHVANTETSSTAVGSPVGALETNPTSREDELRLLVLKSRAGVKTKPSVTEPISLPQAPAQPAGQVVSAAEMDMLAESFIADAISGVQAPYPPSHLYDKIALAAKEARLQEHITASKTLMARLPTATKEEKAKIMNALRELNKSMEAAIAPPPPQQPSLRQKKSCFSLLNATLIDCVISLSDDEDENE